MSQNLRTEDCDRRCPLMTLVYISLTVSHQAMLANCIFEGHVLWSRLLELIESLVNQILIIE